MRSSALLPASTSCYVVDLFVRLGQLSPLSMSSTDEFTDTARRYLPTINGEIDFMSVEKDQLTNRLRQELPDRFPDLSMTLAESVHTYIAEANEAFEFLVQDNPLGFGSKRMLEVAQWQHDVAIAIQAKDLVGIWIDDDYRASYAQVASDLKADWKQQHTKVPTESWTRRADAVGKRDRSAEGSASVRVSPQRHVVSGRGNYVGRGRPRSLDTDGNRHSPRQMRRDNA